MEASSTLCILADLCHSQSTVTTAAATAAATSRSSKLEKINEEQKLQKLKVELENWCII